MKRQNKVLAIVCALAMIMTMFSSVVAFAADAPALKAEIVETEMPTTAGSTLTVKVSHTGFETVSISQAQFAIPFDADMFEYDATASNAGSGTLSLAKDGLSVKYAFLDMTGAAPITTSDALATLVFKLKADVTADTDVTFALDKASMTNSDVTYKPDGTNALTVTDATAKIELPYTGVKLEAAANGNPLKAGETISVVVNFGGLDTVSISQAQFAVVFDADMFEYDATASNSGKGTLSLAKDGLSVKYAFLDMTGAAPITTSDALATLVFKLKADVTADTDVTFALDKASMTSSDVTYKPDSANELRAYDATATLSTTPVEPPVDPDDPVDPPIVPDEPEEVPAFETTVETVNKTIAGAKVKVFTATVAPAEGVTAEEAAALIVDDEYQVIFDGKTSDGYAAGWAIATVSADVLKDALANGTSLVNAEISIGGADEVTVSVLDSEGNTVVVAK